MKYKSIALRLAITFQKIWMYIVSADKSIRNEAQENIYTISSNSRLFVEKVCKRLLLVIPIS